MRRKITFTEGYKMLRSVEVGPVSSAFVAFVWVLRGDEITE